MNGLAGQDKEYPARYNHNPAARHGCTVYRALRAEAGQYNRNAAARHGCSVDTAGGDQFSTAGDRRIGGAAVGAVTLHKCDTATDVIAAERISNPDFQDAAAAEHGAGCSSAAQQFEGAAAQHR